MALVKTVSEIYKISSPIIDVYSLLSDFDRIGMLVNMAKGIGMGMGNATMAKLAEKVEDVRFSADSCIVTLKGSGDIGIRIVEKEAPTLIKMGRDAHFPFEFNLWVQLLENGPYDTRIRLTLEADVNLLMKLTLKGKIERGMNQLAEGLSQIPYSMFKLNGIQ